MTHTFAELEVTRATYDEIARKLRAAGYDHAFGTDGLIDMHGIAISSKPGIDPGVDPAGDFRGLR
jgi:hypothetical protein